MLTIILKYLFAGRYAAIFIGAFFEGPIVMTAVGFFIRLGYFEVVPAYFLLLFGDLVADVAWYYVGYFGAHKFIRRFGKYINFKEEASEKIKSLFRKHETKIIFISKITMGFGFALVTLITAGMSHVPIKKFTILNFLGGLIWTAIALSLGYFLGNVYLLVAKGSRIGFIVFAFILLVLGLYGFSKFMRENIKKL